jgi:hypothetical protein
MNNAKPIIVRNRLTAYEAAMACAKADVSIAEGLTKGLWEADATWRWTPSDVWHVAQDNGLHVIYWAEPKRS